MRSSLLIKFILCYIAIALAGFLLLNTAAVDLLDRRIIKKNSENLYTEATSLAESSSVRSDQTASAMKALHEQLSLVASTEHTEILLIDTKGNIRLDTDQALDLEHQELLSDFDPTASGNSYYMTGNFFGHCDTIQVSVMAPIVVSMSTRGYIAILQSKDYMLRQRESVLGVILIFYLLILVLIALLLLFMLVTVYRPLRKIIRGAREFSTGNLEYKIPVRSKDELGQLADSLNVMVGELQETEKFQRNFISNVSHDFRSPLTSIKGYVEAILDGTIPPELQEKYLNVVLFETSRLTKLTQSMLQLNDFNTKAYMLNIRSFDIHPMIKNTAASFEGVCTKRGISIELLLSAPEIYVSADEEKIQQVLYNLLDNAIKFSRDHSSITIETTEKNDKLFVSVKDHGCGIPKNDIGKVFDRFYKADISRGKDRTGTGLGLAIVKEILTTHKQNINVISTEGVGTEFIFTLNLAHPE